MPNTEPLKYSGISHSGGIALLSEGTIDKIAAGEVIESPVSVVKELVENSIDAAAEQIVLTLLDGGKEMIKVSDDGKGIRHRDVALAWKRHATSKIRTAEDLFRVGSMGFRGEALSSMASVADLEIETRYRDEETGTAISVSEGVEIARREISRGTGTTVVVRNLFRHVPVRKKFLGSSGSEVRKILNLISRIALAHPHLSLKVVDHKKVLASYSGETLESRAAQIFGPSLFVEMIPLRWESSGIKFKGFAGDPSHCRGRSTHQFFYINSRHIHSPLLSRAFFQGYTQLPQGKFPVGALFLEMSPADVDVNVHPTKREVRFKNESDLFQWVVGGVRRALRDSLGAPPVLAGAKPKLRDDETDRSPEFFYQPDHSKDGPMEVAEENQMSLLDGSSRQKIVEWATPGKSLGKGSPTEEAAGIKAIPYLQLRGSYILFEVQSGLMMVHQRYAHQRILYEEAMDVLKVSGRLTSQQLLFPEIIDLSSGESQLLVSSLAHFKSLGFDLEHFGGETFQVRGIPSEVPQNRTSEVVQSILHSLSEGATEMKSDPFSLVARAYASGACLPLGEPLNYEKMAHLINRLFATQNPYLSPYGKAVVVRYRLEDIEKKFG